MKTDDADPERPTRRPRFDTEQYARESDGRIEGSRPSAPPTPPPPAEYERLRESCKGLAAVAESGTVEASAARARDDSLDLVPVLAVAREDVEWFGLDTAARALVSLVDETRTVGQILACANVDAADGVAIFERLADEGIVALL